VLPFVALGRVNRPPILLLTTALLLVATMLSTQGSCPAGYTCRYVDNSCANNGDGTVDSCAASGGGVGRYNSLTTAMAAFGGADKAIIIHPGNATYVTSNGTGYSNGDEGFHVTASGTSGHPFIIKGFDGESAPTLAACADGVVTLATCNRPVLTLGGKSFVRVTGLSVRGMLSLFSAGDSNLIDHNTLTQGYTSCGDGNWTTLWLSDTTNTWVHHNTFTDMKASADYLACNATDFGQYIKMFEGFTSIIEYNTFTADSSHQIKGVFNDKQATHNSIFRYNYASVYNATAGYVSPTQTGSGNIGDTIQQNVFYRSGPTFGDQGALNVQGAMTGDQYIGNTMYGWDTGVISFDQLTSGTFINNIVANVQEVTERFGGAYFTPTYTLRDYNLYQTGKTPSLATLQGAFGGDSHSSFPAGGFGFTNTATGDLTLAVGSAAINACKMGGVSGGATIDCGAYANGITCVGATCGSSASTYSLTRLRGLRRGDD
jgi:hypothetical protein